MKAVGLYRYLPIDNHEALLDLELPMPQAGGRDLLVRVHAIAANPVDTKVRRPGLRNPANKVEESPKILGWDAAGEVVEVGAECTLFKPGDKVFYAGDITRQGCNAEYQLIDERIVGRMPATLDYVEAAALPLTALTAWESLFDRLAIAASLEANQGKSLLIIGGAGGVGSVAIQLAAKIAGLQVIATASRPETVEWVKSLGAQHVVNHRNDLIPQFTALGTAPDYILCCNDTDAYFNTMAELIKPQGRICTIVETTQPVDIGLLKNKSASFGWELMYTRSMYQTPDMIEQHHILQRIAELVDAGTLRTTLNQTLTPINATNLRHAHAQIESGTTIGKIVLSGWA